MYCEESQIIMKKTVRESILYEEKRRYNKTNMFYVRIFSSL